ncbi:MAG: ribonuclease HIII [Parachlamydiaceae bacterium]|nr:ribonuclease HIII [Parachlamydiaceae bacterium]
MSNKPNHFVSTIDLGLADKLRADLISQGFELSTPQYTLFAAKKPGLSCTLYQSGKLMVQGKEMASFLEFYLEPEILKNVSFSYPDVGVDDTARIGIDESGKGDFFGPLCVAGVYASGADIARLKTLGVRDSKVINDTNIRKIGKAISADYAHHVVRINPLKYNELYLQFGNLNLLLGWGHATTIEQLIQKTGCHNVIIDQFAAEHVVINALKRKKLSVSLHQRHRGEEDLVVAAASILARQAFLEGLERLKEEIGVELPKGASAATIATGRALVKKYGPEVLNQVGKLHFKTRLVILGQQP